MVAIRRVDRHVGAVGIGCLRLVCNGTGAAARSGIGPIVERHVLQPFARERLAQLLLIGEVVASIMQSRPVDRKSVGEGKSGSVRVSLGGRRNIKKKKDKTSKS